MAKYKLIEKYPGLDDSVKEGDIAEKKEDVWVISRNERPFSFKAISEDYFSNYPKHWEKIVEKDYEILSFRNTLTNTLATLRKNNYYVLEKLEPVDCPNGKGESLHNMLNNSAYEDWEIYSVRRNSDGKIFTISDKVKCVSNKKSNSINYLKGRELSILEIKVNNFNLKGYTYAKDKGDIFFRTGITEGWIPLLDCELISNPIFTTEDGVDMYEGDKFYMTFVPFNNKNRRKVSEQVATKYHKNYPFSSIELPFSTKEAAKEHILITTPCLSLKDVSKYYKYLLDFSNGNSKGLRELVKTKLE